jgi:MFS family permease
MATITQVREQRSSRPSTLSALRSPNFRLYFAGQLVSISGTWMQNIAQGFLVFSLTHSELWLGIVACAAGLPMILMSPVAGVIVERIPRRTLLMMTQTVQMLLAFVLAMLTFTGAVQVWHIVVLALILGVTNALDMPARQTFVVEMVGREDLHSGIALNSILNSMGRVLGPTAAGLALVQLGAAWCFLINGVSFLAVLISLFLMKVPYAIKVIGKASPLEQLKEGLSYARRDPVIAPLLLLASVGGLFVVPLIQILPAFADVVLHSPKEAYAVLSSAQGLGSVVGGALVGWLAHRFGYGKIIVASLALSAAATVLMSFQVTIPLAAFMSALVGTFMILQFVSLNTLLQTIVPDEFRGRIMSLYTLAFLGLAPFGALGLGGLANILGTPNGMALYGALGGLFGVLILLRWPSVMRQQMSDSRSPSKVRAIKDMPQPEL